MGTVAAVAQGGAGSGTGPQTNSSVIAPDGTAHVTRVVPVPTTISPEAQRVLARPATDKNVPQTLAERRTGTDKWQNGAGEAFRALYPVDVQEKTVAGVPVRVITPPAVPANHHDRVLINLHGGGFNSDSGSLTESIPVAALSGTQVVAVLYRLAPEHKFPAAVDDAVAVYRELLKTHRPQDIGIFGTSAGAILTAEVAVQLRRSGLPLPAALGVFSGMGDFSRNGDSQSLYALNGLSGYLPLPKPPEEGHGEYTGSTSLKDPVLSPVFADLHGMPPTLFITSGRDLLLSGTTILHRAFLRAGADARLVVFEALPHAFWNDPKLPETREANEIMANFFSTELGK
ncbi:MAG TPA: alpha/beta hydrolase [Acidobacteriaceae bacterium]|nr:alpha/beta hydrolase [Acidobacteriaceae bacterium]